MKNWFWQNAQGETSEASTLADLIDAARRGEIGPSTQVSNDGEHWKSAADVPALANALGLAVPPTTGAGGSSYPPQKKGLSGCAIAAIVLGVCFVLFVWVAIGLLLPAVQAAREKAQAAVQGARSAERRMHCANNLRTIMLATRNYADANDDALPAAYTVDEEGKPLHSWRVALLPYLGEEAAALYEQIRLDEPWDSEWNSQFHNQTPVVFACPSFRVAGQTDAGTPPTLKETTYSVVVGDETAFPSAGKGRKWEEIADGTSNTLAVVERKTPVCWMDPTAELTLETLAAEVGSEHTGMGAKREPGFNAATLDGAVRFVVTSTDAATLNAWATAAAGD